MRGTWRGIGWGTAVQAWRSRVRCSEIFIDKIFPAALWLWDQFIP